MIKLRESSTALLRTITVTRLLNMFKLLVTCGRLTKSGADELLLVLLAGFGYSVDTHKNSKYEEIGMVERNIAFRVLFLCLSLFANRLLADRSQVIDIKWRLWSCQKTLPIALSDDVLQELTTEGNRIVEFGKWTHKPLAVNTDITPGGNLWIRSEKDFLVMTYTSPSLLLGEGGDPYEAIQKVAEGLLAEPLVPHDRAKYSPRVNKEGQAVWLSYLVDYTDLDNYFMNIGLLLYKNKAVISMERMMSRRSSDPYTYAGLGVSISFDKRSEFKPQHGRDIPKAFHGKNVVFQDEDTIKGIPIALLNACVWPMVDGEFVDANDICSAKTIQSEQTQQKGGTVAEKLERGRLQTGCMLLSGALSSHALEQIKSESHDNRMVKFNQWGYKPFAVKTNWGQEGLLLARVEKEFVVLAYSGQSSLYRKGDDPNHAIKYIAEQLLAEPLLPTANAKIKTEAGGVVCGYYTLHCELAIKFLSIRIFIKGEHAVIALERTLARQLPSPYTFEGLALRVRSDKLNEFKPKHWKEVPKVSGGTSFVLNNQDSVEGIPIALLNACVWPLVDGKFVDVTDVCSAKTILSK